MPATTIYSTNPESKGQIVEKISKLRCEGVPRYTADPWRVYIDDELISETSEPIYPFETLLGLFYHHPDRQQNNWVRIRAMGEYIVWFSPVFMGQRLTSSVPFDVKVFHRRQYAAAIGCAEEDLRLSDFFPEEFHKMIWSRFPLRDEAIYTIPALPDDPCGDHLVKRVYRYFFDAHPLPWSEGVEVTEPPERWGEIRIGLERDGFPEAVWRVGRTPDGIAVWFVKYPSFPLWLCGEHVDRAFAPFIDAIIESTNGNVKD